MAYWENIPEFAGKVTTDVKIIQYNCIKWRLKISLGKTEVTLFQAEKKEDNIVRAICAKLMGIISNTILIPNF